MKTALVTMFLISTSLFAGTSKSHKMMPMEMTPEQRVKMATAHENMAGCLKSDKSLETCHSEMMDSCKSTMGDEACHMGKMKHNKMMKQ